MDASREELSGLPFKPDKLSYTATLMSTPERDTREPSDSPARLQHFDLLARHHSGSQVSQSNPDLFTNTKVQVAGAIYHTNHWAEDLKGESLGKYSAPAAESGPAAPAHRSRSKKKTLKDGQVRRELHSQAAPPPTDDSLQLLADVLSRGRTDGERKEGIDSATLQKRGEHFSPQRRGAAKLLSQDENVIPYGQPGFLPQVQMSGYGSLGGGVLSRASTAGRRRDENLM